MKLPHAASVALADGHGVVLDADVFALLGQVADEVGDVAADGADVGAFQLEAGEVVQFVKTDPALDGELVGVDPLELGVLRIELVLDFADQVLEDVVERDDADGRSSGARRPGPGDGRTHRSSVSACGVPAEVAEGRLTLDVGV